ncbi:hypothetical protein BCON_0071g00410 [Botryotinia convoluta]|uniref:Uncharacterized protein n=1 Tax=Botryotinia convoluta TaxID=54673 RepID=A0A4Z1I6B3_9HELO|nr:hypothetical protein BCON_0071g00410 [Botryotinia convoluta]
MRELLWDEMNALEAKWTIEKRFRVVEVFLAVLFIISVVPFKDGPSAATHDSAYGRGLGASNSNEEPGL